MPVLYGDFPLVWRLYCYDDCYDLPYNAQLRLVNIVQC